MKFFIIIALALSSFTAKATPNMDPITPVVLESFQNTFRNADEVNWTESKYFFKAEFLFNGQYVSAFFTKGGYLIATAKNLVFSELPLGLQINFKESYNDFWITDLFEMTKDGETTYYITVENADQKTVLQSSLNNWSVFDKKSK